MKRYLNFNLLFTRSSLISRIDDEVKNLFPGTSVLSVHIDCKTIRFVFVVARRLVVCCRRSRYRHSHYTLFSSLLLSFCHLPNVKENAAMLCCAVVCRGNAHDAAELYTQSSSTKDNPTLLFPPWRHRSFIAYVVCVYMCSSTMKKFAHLRTCNLSCIMSHLFHRLNAIEILRQRKDPIFEMGKTHLNSTYFARVIYSQDTYVCNLHDLNANVLARTFHSVFAWH